MRINIRSGAGKPEHRGGIRQMNGKRNRHSRFANACFFSVPGMAQFLRVKVPSQVFTAKCSEPQAAVSNDGRGGSGVAKPRSLRTETGYKAKRWVRVLSNPKPER